MTASPRRILVISSAIWLLAWGWEPKSWAQDGSPKAIPVQAVCEKGKCSLLLPEGIETLPKAFPTTLTIRRRLPFSADESKSKISIDGAIAKLCKDQVDGWQLYCATNTGPDPTITIGGVEQKVTLWVPLDSNKSTNFDYELGTESFNTVSLSATKSAVATSLSDPDKELHNDIDKSVNSDRTLLVNSGRTFLRVENGVADKTARLRPETLPEHDEEYDFPGVLLIGSQKGFHCTGILVHPLLVLTAKHCLPATHVGIGNSSLAPWLVSEIQSNIAYFAGDAVLLVLNIPIAIPVHPRRRHRDITPPNGALRMVGFGMDDPARGQGFGQKRRVDVNAFSWGCDRRRARSLGCNPSLEMVIVGDGGRDSCGGDSGGPVFERTETGWRLVAITLRPSNRRGRSQCGRGGIYLRVDKLDAFIDAAIETVERKT